MSATANAPSIGPAVLRHMNEQIVSARTLLDQTLKQGAAIRARDVDAVVRRLQEINVEMTKRQSLELERSALLDHAGAALGKPGVQVRLEDMTPLMAPQEAEQARALSAQLRGLLNEVQRETQLNRSLMRQELAFLDHLLRLAGQPSEPGYRPTGEQPLATTRAGARTPLTRRLFDMEA